MEAISATDYYLLIGLIFSTPVPCMTTGRLKGGEQSSLQIVFALYAII